MSEPDWPTYVCSYQFDGSEWGIQVKARSFEEAQRRIRAIGLTAKVDGQLYAIIDATPGAGLAVRVSCWLRNIAQALR